MERDGGVAYRKGKIEGVTDFISWTWRMLHDDHREVHWSADGDAIVVTNPERLVLDVLPKYYRSANYMSWVRALNAYGFQKIGKNSWRHTHFRRGRPELLHLITRPPKKAAVRQREAYRALAEAQQLQHAQQGLAVSSAAPTALTVQRSSALAHSLAEERTRLWWLRNELSRLEQEVVKAKQEDFQQKFDTLRLTQLMMTQLNLASTADGHETAPSALAQPAAGSTPLLLTDSGGVGGAPSSGASNSMIEEIDKDGTVRPLPDVPMARGGAFSGSRDPIVLSLPPPASRQVSAGLTAQSFDAQLADALRVQAARSSEGKAEVRAGGFGPLSGLIGTAAPLGAGGMALSSTKEEQLAEAVNLYFQRLTVAAERASDSLGPSRSEVDFL